MKIALLADPIDNQNAGIHVYTREMALSIQQYCKRIDLQVIRQGENSSVVTKNNIIIKEKSIPGYRALRMFCLIPLSVRRLKPEIVIEPAHFGPFNLPKSIKRITIIHDLTPVMFPELHHFHHSLLQKIFLPSILNRAKLIITNSDNTLKDLRSKYPFTKEKSIRIYPGVDPFYKLLEGEFSQQKEPFFLTTGTIEPRKNLSVLLDAYQQFREKSNLSHKLVICGGKGWKSDNFYQKLEQNPYRKDIELMGFVDKKELKRLYCTTTAFIYPSLYEGFGFPVVEAMSCGATCIISNTSSLPEVGGDAAIYFDPKNPADLAIKLTEVASSEKIIRSLSQKVFDQSALFSWEHFALELEKILLMLK